MNNVKHFSHREQALDGETWTLSWIYEADADRALTDEDVERFADNCLEEVTNHHCMDHGSCVPGGIFHHRPYIAFRAGGGTRGRQAVVIIRQFGGYDI